MYKTILKKEKKVGGRTLPHFKTYCESTGTLCPGMRVDTRDRQRRHAPLPARSPGSWHGFPDHLRGEEACAQCRRCHHVTGRRRLGSRASSSARCGGQAGWVKERLGVSKPPPLVPFLAFQKNVLGSTKDYVHGHAKYEYKKENDSRTNHPAITIT